MSKKVESQNTVKVRLKRKLLGKYLTRNVRMVIRARLYHNFKMFQKSILEGREPEFPMERLVENSNDMWNRICGHVIHVYDVNPIFSDVLIKLNDLQLAHSYQTGNRAIRFKCSKDHYFENIQGDKAFWIRMKRIYKEHKRDQEETRKLRLQGKIGRDYFEEW